MKKCIKICFFILFLFICGFAIWGDLTEYQLKYGKFGGIGIFIGATLLFALLNLLFFSPNIGVFSLMKGEGVGKVRNIICLIVMIVVYPLILLLFKPVTVAIGEFLIMEIGVYGIWYQSGLTLFNLGEAHFYPALKILIGEFNCSWIIGLIFIAVFVFIITAINGAKDEMDEQYNYDLKHIEHKQHLEITDTITYSGIFTTKENHDIKTKVVDDTEYPIHNIVWVCIFLALGVIFTPYITFFTLITRQVVTIVKS